MRKRTRHKGSGPPTFCRFGPHGGQICGAPLAWISGVKYPVNPGAIEILLWEEGSPRIEGVTLQGDECWGRKRKAGEDGRVVEVWTRHICEHQAGSPISANPDTRAKSGADRATGEGEE